MFEQADGQVDWNTIGDRVREFAEESAIFPIARRLLGCSTATVRFDGDTAYLENALAAPINLDAVGMHGAALVVTGEPDRVWSADEVDALGEVAACFACALQREMERASSPLRRPTALSAVLSWDDESNREVRTSLQAIIGFTELMKRETRPDLIAAHATTIQETTESLMRHFGQLAGDICAVQGGTEDSIPAAPTAEAAHILLADDLDLNRKLICDMLSLDGHTVDSVADGASAVKAACERSYDLILMDMIMPGMDGVTATRAIRALPAPACEVPIVALTAHSQPEQLDSCLQAGMDATLTKPMSIDALTDAVATWTRRRRKAA